MAWLKGKPRFEVTLLRIARLVSGRYSVRHPLESSGASAAAPANHFNGDGCRMGKTGKSDSTFAIYSPKSQSIPTVAPRQVKLGVCSAPSRCQPPAPSHADLLTRHLTDSVSLIH